MVANTPLELYISHWAGWKPDSANETPDIRFLPALLRRRLDRLGRMTLHAAWKCLQSAGYVDSATVSLPTIFATRHGDVVRTRQLLSDLAHNEALSPTAFSLSVHNSIAGLYSIARKDTAATTVISAGIDTLPQALLEAAGSFAIGSQTRESQAGEPHNEILLVYADDAIPDDYDAYLPQPQPCLALALLLRSDNGPLRLQLGYTPQTRDGIQAAEVQYDNTVHQSDPATILMNTLKNKESEAVCNTERFCWRFECHG